MDILKVQNIRESFQPLLKFPWKKCGEPGERFTIVSHHKKWVLYSVIWLYGNLVQQNEKQLEFRSIIVRENKFKRSGKIKNDINPKCSVSESHEKHHFLN